jgi:hypothetical protein
MSDILPDLILWGGIAIAIGVILAASDKWPH